jgi:hypothetical protein
LNRAGFASLGQKRRAFEPLCLSYSNGFLDTQPDPLHITDLQTLPTRKSFVKKKDFICLKQFSIFQSINTRLKYRQLKIFVPGESRA